MPYVSNLVALRQLDRKAFERTVLDALTATRGNVTHAGWRLRANYRTLRRVLAAEPELDAFARRVRRLAATERAEQAFGPAAVRTLGHSYEELVARARRDTERALFVPTPTPQTELHNLCKQPENAGDSAMTIESESASFAPQPIALEPVPE